MENIDGLSFLLKLLYFVNGNSFRYNLTPGPEYLHTQTWTIQHMELNFKMR